MPDSTPRRDFAKPRQSAKSNDFPLQVDKTSELVGFPVPDRLPADPPFTPTSAMIRERCCAIQSGWTSTERRSVARLNVAF